MENSSSRKPRVTRVLLAHEPPDGGVSQHVKHLALGLREQGFEVEIAGPRESVIAEELRLAGIRVHALEMVRTYRRPDQDLRATLGLRALLRTGRFDLVHGHSSKAGVMARVAAKLTAVPVVYSPHWFGFVGDVSQSRKLFARSVEHFLGPLTDAIICVCEAERRIARQARIAPADRLHVVHSGVPACRSSISPDPELSEWHAEGPVVGTISRLERPKRVDLILQAIPQVWRSIPEACFAIVGNGQLEAQLRSLASALALDRDPRFRFLPFAAPSERYLQRFDLFVLSSDWEALPVGLLEAMACGVPQVATDVGGVREAVGTDTGRIVRARDPDSLAGALVGLLGDPGGRAAMSAASTLRHNQQFSVDKMAQETADLYRSLSARSNRPRGVLGQEHTAVR